MAVSRIRIHLFDATSGTSLPNLFDCVQLLRLSELQERFEGDPVRTPIKLLASHRLPEFVELQIEVETPFIAEVRLYDPPAESWPTQEWAMLRPGQDDDIRVAVYHDGASWPGNGRDKLRAFLLSNASQLGTYSAIKGRFIAPEGPPFYEFYDAQVWLKKVDGHEKIDARRMCPMILPEKMAQPWFAVPIPAGTWDLVVAGARVQTWSRRLDLAPGQTIDLGDVRLAIKS